MLRPFISSFAWHRSTADQTHNINQRFLYILFAYGMYHLTAFNVSCAPSPGGGALSIALSLSLYPSEFSLSNVRVLSVTYFFSLITHCRKLDVMYQILARIRGWVTDDWTNFPFSGGGFVRHCSHSWIDQPTPNIECTSSNHRCSNYCFSFPIC